MLFAVSRLAMNLDTHKDQVQKVSSKLMKKIATNWNTFEKAALKNPLNARYFVKGVFNFDGYFKGAIVVDDIKAFTWG